MQELINTSVPNGLIPGTHGFATVAMSEGLAERLRIELEELSAYRHRVSTHGDAYVTENPVAWSHVILRSGQHVVSRIAASPFDYTGRTNRLAHHLVFTAQEIAGANGADILLRAAPRLSVPWSGDPRLLPPDEAAESLLSSTTTGTSAWETLFGSDGATYAQRLAWLLARDLSSPLRPVAFLYDAATEGDGRRLLALFAEVIALLPASVRDQVTFSTYADCLPQGTRCLLRGVADQSATRGMPIVFDCRTGRLLSGENLLPSEPVAFATAPVIAPAEAKPGTAVPVDDATAAAMPAADAETLPPPESPRREWGLIIACSVVGLLSLIALAVFILVMSQRDSSSRRTSSSTKQDASAASTADPAEVTNAVSVADSPVTNPTSPSTAPDSPAGPARELQSLFLPLKDSDFKQDRNFTLDLDGGGVTVSTIELHGECVWANAEPWSLQVVQIPEFDPLRPVIRRAQLDPMVSQVKQWYDSALPDADEDVKRNFGNQVDLLDESVIKISVHVEYFRGTEGRN